MRHETLPLSARSLPLCILLLLTLLLLATTCARAGAPRVANPADPPGGTLMLAPTELWRLGDEESGHLLGFVSDVQVGADGTCYLLDGTLSRISVLSPDGDVLRDIGGEGEGPAEFQNASRLLLLPGGDLGVIQTFPAKVVALTPDGLPGPHFSVCGDAGGLSVIEHGQSAGDHLVLGTGCADFAAGGVDYALQFVDANGSVLRTILSGTEISDNGSISVGGDHDFEFVEYWALAPDGRVFVAPEKHAYRIDVYDARGRLERTIERDYETLRRSAADLKADRERAEEMKKRFGGMVTLVSREYERDIAALHARPGGELWVASSRGLRDCPAGAVGLFDVFSAEGRLLRRVGLKADYDPEYDDFVIVGDLLFVLKQAKARPATTSTSVTGGLTTLTFSGGVSVPDDDEAGEEIPPSVVCYRLP